MKALQRVTGTQDLFPEDLAKIDYVTGVFKEVCKVFDYREYETPTFEYTSLFTRGIGETTDIVNKEMFTFVPRGDSQKDSITLKPEGTASIVRLYNQHNLQSKKPPLKLFYITPCFRNERNQKGRFKEFHQFGTEILGSDAASTDAEIITLAYRFFERLGIMDNITLEINSVGGFESRKAYNEKLREFLKDDFDKLCDTCKERYDKNPMRIIDCKEKTCNNITKNAPLMIDNIFQEEKEHFEKVKRLLDAAGVKYVVNPNIVRGLDYYTKTAFEFVSKHIGSQATVCGGGRYDGLVKELGGADISGVGFGLGIERLIMTLDELGKMPEFKVEYDLYIASLGEEADVKSFEIVDKLRKKGIVCDKDHVQKSLKAQMKYADDKNAHYTLMLGENELESGKATLKDMTTSTQIEVELDNFEEEFLKILKK